MESRVATSTASPLAVLRPGSLTAYWRFQRAVAKAQLAAWLPAGRRLLVDISGPAAACPAQAAGSGHAVVRVVTAHPGVDYDLVAKRARLLLDLRGVTRSIAAANVVRL